MQYYIHSQLSVLSRKPSRILESHALPYHPVCVELNRAEHAIDSAFAMQYCNKIMIKNKICGSMYIGFLIVRKLCMREGYMAIMKL